MDRRRAELVISLIVHDLTSRVGPMQIHPQVLELWINFAMGASTALLPSENPQLH